MENYSTKSNPQKHKIGSAKKNVSSQNLLAKTDK